MFNLYFTIITSVGFGSTIFIGYFYRNFGTRKTRILASITYASGCVMLALFDKETAWLLGVGGTLIVPAGYTFLLTSYQLHLGLPDRSSTVVGLLAGSFDSSSVVLLVVKTLYINGITRKTSFLAMAGLSLTTLISTFAFFPKIFIDKKVNNLEINVAIDKQTERSDKTKIELDNNNKLMVTIEKGNKNDRNNDRQETEIDVCRNSRISVNTHVRTKSLKDKVFSMLYFTFIVWHVFTFFRFIFFIGTINNTIETLTNGTQELVSYFTNVISITMFCGFFTSFGAGLLYDVQRKFFKVIQDESRRKQMSSILPLSTTSILAVILSLLSFVDHQNVVYPAAITVTLLRSVMFTVTPIYITDTFTLSDMGFLMPLTSLLAIIFACFQYAFFHWENVFKNAYIHVNIVTTILAAASFIHPINVYLKVRNKHSHLFNIHAETDGHVNIGMGTETNSEIHSESHMT